MAAIRPFFLFAAVTAAGISLSGCAGDGKRYPSLAIRPVENQPSLRDTGAPIEPAPIAAETSAKIEQWRTEAEARHHRFLERLPKVRQSLRNALGAPPESNRWTDAFVVFSDLASLRSRNAIVLADLDVELARAVIGLKQRETIDEARAQLEQWVAIEDKLLDELEQTLPILRSAS